MRTCILTPPGGEAKVGKGIGELRRKRLLTGIVPFRYTELVLSSDFISWL